MTVFFQSKEQVIPFLDYLNSKHPNIQFTHELEDNGSLSFLDINITRTNGRFSTSVFHKPTSTGLFTNFNSFIPMTYKKGLLLSLISRYFNYQSFHCELQNFKQIFSLNGYPTSLIDNCIRTFLDNIFSPKPLVHSCSKKILFFCIPYTGQHGLQIRTQCVYQRAIRFPTTRKTKVSHRFPFFVFQFWKTTWKTKLAYTLNLSKGQLFSERAINGKRILKQILFSIFRKKVTLAQTSFGTSFSGVGSRRSTPPRFFP